MRRGTISDFWAKVNRFGRIVSAELGHCWEFTGKPHTDGYAMIRRRPNPPILVHRYSYELLVGQIPKGLTLDHRCKIRHCVNPAHLEPVTLAVNIGRGSSPSAINARKTQCPKGHYYADGSRFCKVCRSEYHKKYYHSKWKLKAAAYYQAVEKLRRKERKSK